MNNNQSSLLEEDKDIRRQLGLIKNRDINKIGDLLDNIFKNFIEKDSRIDLLTQKTILKKIENSRHKIYFTYAFVKEEMKSLGNNINNNNNNNNNKILMLLKMIYLNI